MAAATPSCGSVEGLTWLWVLMSRIAPLTFLNSLSLQAASGLARGWCFFFELDGRILRCVCQVLRDSRHNGFPVVRDTPSGQVCPDPVPA